jgi:hypothetical protein
MKKLRLKKYRILQFFCAHFVFIEFNDCWNTLCLTEEPICMNGEVIETKSEDGCCTEKHAIVIILFGLQWTNHFVTAKKIVGMDKYVMDVNPPCVIVKEFVCQIADLIAKVSYCIVALERKFKQYSDKRVIYMIYFRQKDKNSCILGVFWGGIYYYFFLKVSLFLPQNDILKC